MKTTIIGTGNIGTGLAVSLARAGHDVYVGARTDEAAQVFVRRLQDEHQVEVRGAEIAKALQTSDIVFLAVPYSAMEALAAEHDFSGKVIVDVTNPVKADFSGLSLGHTTSAGEAIQTILPSSLVVKGFNTIFAGVYADSATFGQHKAQTFLAADDADAKASVAALAESMGFDPVDAGPLDSARLLEPLAMMNIRLGYGLGRGTNIVPVWLER